MNVTFDEIDRRILGELQRDGMQSLETLGARIGLSRNAAWRRIKRLEDDGIIRGRVALLDAEALDLGLTVFIQVRTNRHDPEWLESFARAVRKLPEILGTYRMSGDLDYLIRARVRDMQAYDRLDAMPDNLPEVRYPRSPGRFPDPSENPLNAWYVKTEVRGAPDGKLRGKRIALKDTICLAGVPMMNGASTLKGYVPDVDATIVTRLLDAGG